MWLTWLIISAVLVTLEVLTQMIWTICLAVGCLAACIATWCGYDLAVQIGVLGGGAILAFIFLMPWLKKLHSHLDEKEKRNARTGMDALLGRRATVCDEIKPGQLGRVKIDGDNWQVRAPHIDNTIKHGEEVVVTGYDSIILTVAPIQ